jgi:hypothetical protein
MPTYSRTASAFQVASKTGGGTSWTNEGNILANDAAVATSAATTQYLVASSPNVNWLVGPPAEGDTATGNPTLTNLTVTIETASVNTGTGTMELYQDGNLVSSAKNYSPTYTLNAGGGSQTQTWSGGNDYWELTLTNVFSLDNISVRFKAQTSAAITCDYIAASFTISQEYTSGGGGSTRRRAVYVAKNNPDN